MTRDTEAMSDDALERLGRTNSYRHVAPKTLVRRLDAAS